MSAGGAGWRRALRFFRADPASDVDAELRFHFDQKIADFVAQGMTADEARARATAEFGDPSAVRSSLVAIDTRVAEQRGRAEWWESIAQDLGYVLRSLRRSPGFTAVVALTLALGIGANAATYSVLERILWRQPPVVLAPREVKRVQVRYTNSRTKSPGVMSVYTYASMRELRDALPSRLTLAAFREDKLSLGRDAGGRGVTAVYVIGDYFGVLGVTPAAGRFFTPEEARAETFSAVAIISYRLWRSEFGGTATAIGRPIDFGSHRYTVIGVAPESFQGLGLDAVDVWLPRSTRGIWRGRDAQWYTNPRINGMRLITRARTPSDEQTITGAATHVLREVHMTGDSTASAVLAPAIEAVWPDGGTKELSTATRLAAVAAIILLIACANVANLQLARGLRRRREIAVRLALGVGRRRLIRQLLTESVALAFVAATGAVVLGGWSAYALRHALFPQVTWDDAVLDFRIVGFTFALAFVTGIVAGVAPALQATKPDLLAALKGSARDGAVHRSRLRNTLIVAQTALSIVLLAIAGLFVHSLANVRSTDIGYESDRLLYAWVNYDPELGDPRPEIAARLPELATRVAQIPGVERVGMMEYVPFEAFRFSDVYPPGAAKPLISGQMLVSPGFFSAAGTRVLSGRGFTDRDVSDKRRVIIVNATMAKTVWPGQSAVGKCLVVDEPKDPCREVIGVVADVHKTKIIEEPSPQYFMPLEVAYTLVIRTAPGRAASVAAPVRDMMKTSFAGWLVPRTKTMEEVMAPELHPWRLAATIFLAAGLLALIIAAVGVYSSVTYSISQRMREMGVRVALGARGTHIIRLVIGEGVGVVMIGVALGAGLSLAFGRVIQSLLYNISPRDPGTLAAVSATLLFVAAVACVVPAWRAMRANPVEALRAD